MYTEETTIFSVILTALVIVIIIIGYFVYTIIKANRNETARKKMYMFNEIKVLEKERERIALNIHDSAGPELSLLKLNLDNLELFHEKERIKVQKMKNQIDEILVNLRTTSHNLMPTVLLNYGLIAAIKELTENMSKPSLRIEFTADAKSAISHDIAIHIYRILEEFIYNTIKHANATRIKITFKEENQYYLFNARDNGKGFNMSHSRRVQTSLGLKGFEYRTELLGGEFDIYSEEGKGIEIKIKIPI
jgi:signal transduction histidine kinase